MGHFGKFNCMIMIMIMNSYKYILSNHQQGGITAETVNANNLSQDNFTKISKKRRNWYTNPWLVTIFGGIIVTVVAGIILGN